MNHSMCGEIFTRLEITELNFTKQRESPLLETCHSTGYVDVMFLDLRWACMKRSETISQPTELF